MGYCLVLKEWKLREMVEDVSFTEVDYLVQVQNMPMEMLTRINAEAIGKKIGKMVEVEDPRVDTRVGKGFISI